MSSGRCSVLHRLVQRASLWKIRNGIKVIHLLPRYWRPPLSSSTGCGHIKGKAVVSRGKAFARAQVACNARNEGRDIFVLAGTDSLILDRDEAMARAKEFKRIGVDAVFVEALPDREAMSKCIEELHMPVFANIKYSFCFTRTLSNASHNSHRRKLNPKPVRKIPC